MYRESTAKRKEYYSGIYLIPIHNLMTYRKSHVQSSVKSSSIFRNRRTIKKM